MAKKGEDEKDEKVQSSFGFGLGGLLEGIGKLVESAAKLQQSAGKPGEIREFTIPGLGKKAKGIFGFSVKPLAGGEGQGVELRPFGNIHKTEQGVAVEEATEPVVDVFEEENEVRLVAELPGVSEGDIKFEINNDILTISTKGDRQYNAEVLLPNPVDSASVESSYRNGILELKVKRADT